MLEFTLNRFLTYGFFKTRQGKELRKILSVLLGFCKASSLLIRRIGQPSMLLPCYLCFKSSTGAIVEKGQDAVEVIITLNFSFPFPPFPLLWWINRPVCTHNTTRPFCTIEYESIHTPPPQHTAYSPPILIPRMSLRNLPQNKSQLWIWQCLYEECSLISGWWLFGSSTQERRGFLCGSDAAQLILIAIFYSET